MKNGKINCFIIEDDPIALFWLLDTLKSFIDVTICGYASTKSETLEKIKNLEIDLVFADIVLEECTAFDILEALDEVPEFGIVFITSHTHFALKAIKANALDFITKPVNEKDVREAINRFKTNREQQLGQLKKLLSYLNQNQAQMRLALPLNTHTELVDVDNIIYFKADSNYCHVYLKNGASVMVSKTLKEFTKQLIENTSFFRIHQSYLINTNHIEKIIKTKLPQIVMLNGDTLTVSRSKKAEFLTKILPN